MEPQRAKAFQQVGYPILLQIDVAPPGDGKVSDDETYRLTMRHYSQILPRDFDLSPNFQIVKVEGGGPEVVKSDETVGIGNL